MLRFLTFLSQLFGAGRSPAALLNLLAPRRGYRVHRDIAYAPGPRHAMDIYVPDALAGPAPVVLFFYGGGFVAGWKNEYRIVGEALASKGIVTAIADYRIHPQNRFPDFLEDGAKAFAGLRRIAADYGGDPERIFAAGHSAGAYIAVMLGLDPRWLAAQDLAPSSLRGVVGIAGPYDFAPIAGAVRIDIFGGANRPETQPVNFAQRKKVPMLLATGNRDGTVQIKSTVNLAARLRGAGSEVEEKIYPGVGHMGIMLALAPAFRRLAPLRDDIARFVSAH